MDALFSAVDVFVHISMMCLMLQKFMGRKEEFEILLQFSSPLISCLANPSVLPFVVSLSCFFPALLGSVFHDSKAKETRRSRKADR